MFLWWSFWTGRWMCCSQPAAAPLFPLRWTRTSAHTTSYRWGNKRDVMDAHLLTTVPPDCVSPVFMLCVQMFTSPDLSLQVHTVLTNLWLLLMLLITVFLSLDYGMPIVWRQEVTINIDEILFFYRTWYIPMIPSSPLSWLSPIWFPSLRSSMPFTSGTRGLPTCPGETSIKSIFICSPGILFAGGQKKGTWSCVFAVRILFCG